MQYFYSNNIDESRCSFSKEESGHIMKSLRKQKGDVIHVLDGLGGIHLCQITQIEQGLVLGEVHETCQVAKPSCTLHLAVAPTKNSGRLETLLEKAIELGLHKFTPLICKRSEKKTTKQGRMERIALATIKQSGNPFLTSVASPTNLSDLIEEYKSLHDQKFIAYLSEEKKLPLFSPDLIKQGSITVLIGPEGDFTEEEICQATEAGFKGVSLGSLRLRTETAGIFVASLVHAQSESFS